MKKVIVDCDAGYDDAVALVLLIAAHKQNQVEIKAITCVNGNVKVDHVVNNVFRTLEACNALDIPVYKGAHSALIAAETSKKAEEIRYHGRDGFGDVFTNTADVSKLQLEHAVVAIHKLITADEISVVCLGPLTNIALAIKVYPEILDIIKEFYIMGGNSTAVGNASCQAEFNFFADCESVHIVLGSNIKPLWLLPWETCIKSCDAFTAAVLLNPDLVIKKTDYHADIELRGTRTRGQVVLDHLQQNEPNVHLIEEIDFRKFEELMFSAFTFSF